MTLKFTSSQSVCTLRKRHYFWLTRDELKVPHVVGEDPEIQGDGEHDGQRPETTNASVTVRSQAARSQQNQPELTSSPLCGTGRPSGTTSGVKDWLLIYWLEASRVLYSSIKDIERRASGTCRLQRSHDWTRLACTCNTQRCVCFPSMDITINNQ